MFGSSLSLLVAKAVSRVETLGVWSVYGNLEFGITVSRLTHQPPLVSRRAPLGTLAAADAGAT